MLQRSTPPGGFWQHAASSWHDGKQKWSKLLLVVLKSNSVVLCPDNVAVIHFSDKFLHYHFLGQTIAAGNVVSVFLLTFIYMCVFWFGENGVSHSVTRFSAIVSLKLTTRNSRKCET